MFKIVIELISAVCMIPFAIPGFILGFIYQAFRMGLIWAHDLFNWVTNKNWEKW